MALNKIKVNNTTTVNTGVVYDITKATNQSYDSLSAALGTNGNNVPLEVREGGMSVKFIQTSDNKYVQYRLAASIWSTDIHDWTSEDPYFVDKIMQEVNEAIDENTPIEIMGDVTNAPDEEDLTSVNVGGTDVLKFKDKTYNPLTYSGMGRKILRKNIVSGVNTLTQSMINQANTIYVIQYDFTLGEDITIPENCVLEFDGGSVSGEHTITGQNTGINAGLVKAFNTDITLSGSWNVTEAYPEWFGAKGDGVTDDTIAIQKVLYFQRVSFLNRTYKISNTLDITNPSQVIKGYKFSEVGSNIGTKIVSSSDNFVFSCHPTGVSSFNGFHISDLYISAKNGIIYYDTTTNIVDGDTTFPYFIRPIIERVMLDSTDGGIGIALSKAFDGIINCCYIRGFNIGLLLRGCDINIVSNNRFFLNKYHIYDVPYGTFGSQNLIIHNDLLANQNNGVACIKSLSRHVTIIDNYFEHSNDYSIDMTNLDAINDINYNIGLFTVVIRDNRHDLGTNANAYRVLNIGFYSIVIDDRRPTGIKKNNILILNTNGESARFKRCINALNGQDYRIKTNNYYYNTLSSKKLVFDSGTVFPKYSESQEIDENRNIYFTSGFKNEYLGIGYGAANYPTIINLFPDIKIGKRYLCTIKLKALNEDCTFTVAWRKDDGSGITITFQIQLTTTEWSTFSKVYIVSETTNAMGLYVPGTDKAFIMAPIEYQEIKVCDTSNRPTTDLYIGCEYFDTTLGKPIYVKNISGTTITWVDSTGATV